MNAPPASTARFRHRVSRVAKADSTPGRNRRRWLARLAVVALLWAPSTTWAQVAPPLGVAQQFGALGNSGVTGAAGAGVVVSGDVGSSPTASISNFPPSSTVPPFIVHNTGVQPDGVVQQARADAIAAYTALQIQGPGTVLPDNLTGAVLTSGIYSFVSGAPDLPASATLTLNGPGIFVFNVGSSLTANVLSNVVGTADPCNIYWRVGTSATLNGVTFRGTVIANASITLGSGANLAGRLLAGTGATGAVTMAGSGGNTVGGCSFATTTLSTQASPDVTLGAAISDTATLSGGLAPTGFVTFNLYGPNDATCAGASIFTSVAPVSGNGVYPSLSFVPTLAGVYRWIANYSGDVNNAATANACNALNEIVVVAPAGAAIPTLTTQASPAVTLGAAISDTATLSGGVGPTGTITFKLYGPNDATCTGAVIFTSVVPVSGNGVYPSTTFTPTLAGTYRWIASYSGDGGNAAVATACDVVNENVIVAPVGAAIPTLTTQASPAVTLGAAISDTATLSGGVGPTGTITFKLYGPNDATCTAVAIFTSVVPVSGNGVYPSLSFIPTLAGIYRWIANYSGDANNAGTTNACNAVNEIVTVAPVGAVIPTLTTQASPAVSLGAAISDTATLSGGLAPTGTITFTLYGPNDATCTNAAIFTSTVPVSGNGVYPSAPFTPTLAGTYRWIVNYSGDANNAPTANACNAPNEVVIVGPPPIPTLSEWAMIVLAALLVLFGLTGIRRYAMS
jgi:hypothetical protein